jgi:DNA-directed RNA polymerase subunit RPC12/RpoP
MTTQCANCGRHYVPNVEEADLQLHCSRCRDQPPRELFQIRSDRRGEDLKDIMVTVEEAATFIEKIVEEHNKDVGYLTQWMDCYAAAAKLLRKARKCQEYAGDQPR